MLPDIPVPPDEDERLAALESYQIMDSAPEREYDDIALMASQICGTPMGIISLIDEDRQWFKARVGLDATETDRRVAFCSHTIMGRDPLVVTDATLDQRFAENSLVTESPGIRFYAGVPLVDAKGHGLGTLCVVDVHPRELDPGQISALQALGRTVIRQLELRRTTRRLGRALERVSTLARMVPLCSFCRRVRRGQNFWDEFETYARAVAGTRLVRSTCPDCASAHA